MSEDGHDDRKADKGRDRAHEKQCRDDQAPKHNRNRIGKGGAYARLHRRDCTDIPVKQQRERHHGCRQHDDRENETGQIAPDDKERPCEVVITSDTNVESETGPAASKVAV